MNNSQNPADALKALVENAFDAVKSALPDNLADDAKQNVKAAIASAVTEMNLVTRDELEAQNKVLQKTREELSRLEEIVKKLEEK